MKKYSVKDINALLIKTLVSRNYSSSEALSISTEVLENELAGKSAFGIDPFIRLLGYNDKKSKSETQILNNECVTIIDAGGKFAHAAFDLYLDDLIKVTKETGLHIVGIKNDTTFISAGYPVRKLVESKLIGISFIQVSTNSVSMPGLQESILGTNPIAIGVPTANEAFIYDGATSALSKGMLQAKIAGDEYAADDTIGINKNGENTKEYSKVQNLLPLGGVRGFGLVMAIELLAGGLLGYALGKNKGNYIADNPIVIIAIDPEHFCNKEFEKSIGDYITHIKTLSPNLHIPGYSYKKIDYTETIDLDEELIKSLKDTL